MTITNISLAYLRVPSTVAEQGTFSAGTGLSAKAALSAVGPTGHVTAADFSAAMAEKARERLLRVACP